ncbi:hypothetical protein Tco_0597492 [Tanacetum coccineum]
MMMVVPVEEVYVEALQSYMHDPLKWRLYDTCGVHHVSTERGMDIFMLVEEEYPLSKGVLMLMLVNKLLQHLLDQKELNMRQCQWLELLSDYDCKIRYHPRKANVILNTQAEAMKEENLCGMNKEFETRADGTLCIEKRSWVPRIGGLKS